MGLSGSDEREAGRVSGGQDNLQLQLVESSPLFGFAFWLLSCLRVLGPGCSWLSGVCHGHFGHPETQSQPSLAGPCR